MADPTLKEIQLQQIIDSLRDELSMSSRLAAARKAMIVSAERLIVEKDAKIRTLQLEIHRIGGLLRQLSGQPGTDKFLRPRQVGEDGSLGGFPIT